MHEELTLASIELKTVKSFIKDSGTLSIIEGTRQTPWAIARSYFISTNFPEVRGGHAHRECSQAIICLLGAVKIKCSTPTKHQTYELLPHNEFLLIPPGIWVDLETKENTVLAVLTDQFYDEADYLRDWLEYCKNYDLT
jgi:hypothetical protein